METDKNPDPDIACGEPRLRTAEILARAPAGSGGQCSTNPGWRLLLDGSHGGAWNMALDEAIFDAVEARLAPSTLRIYQWDSPHVTVGKNQNVGATVSVASCARLDVPIVRRITGGRGILHGGDLTVSIALNADSLPPESRGLIESYRLLSSGFVNALQYLGFDPGMGACERRAAGGGDCFAVRSRADVVFLDGVKVIGSAQRRRGNMILQQSSVRYRRTDAAPGDVFLGTVEEGSYPLQNVSQDRLVGAIIRGFERVLGDRFERFSGATGWEEERCAVLLPSYSALQFAALVEAV